MCDVATIPGEACHWKDILLKFLRGVANLGKQKELLTWLSRIELESFL